MINWTCSVHYYYMLFICVLVYPIHVAVNLTVILECIYECVIMSAQLEFAAISVKCMNIAHFPLCWYYA